MHILGRIAAATSWQVVGKIITSLSTFIILGLVTRNYGQEGTGIFTLALVYLSIFYLLADFGFNAHVLKRIQNSKSETENEWSKLFGTRILWSFVLIIIAVGLLPLWPFAKPFFSLAVVLGSLAILANAIFVTCNLIFQKNLKYEFSVLASSLGTLIGLLIFFLFVQVKFPVTFLLVAHLLTWVFISFSALIIIKIKLLKILPVINFGYILDLFKQSWPLAATLGANVVYFRADSFMIASFKGLADVGIYNVAYSFFQTALVLPTFIMNSYYPLMLKSLDHVKAVALSLFGLAFLGSVLTYFLAPQLIFFLAGNGFDNSTKSLQILSLGFPAYFLSALFMWMLIVKGKYKRVLMLYTFALVFNIILNYIYIPKFSYIAASWITVISEYLILAMLGFILTTSNK